VFVTSASFGLIEYNGMERAEWNITMFYGFDLKNNKGMERSRMK
jgi:hypothetical protein